MVIGRVGAVAVRFLLGDEGPLLIELDLGQHSESVQIEDGEIRSEKRIKTLLKSISPFFIMNKHFTNKGDAHPIVSTLFNLG